MRVEAQLAQLEAEKTVLREQIEQLLGTVAENAALREQVRITLRLTAPHRAASRGYSVPPSSA